MLNEIYLALAIFCALLVYLLDYAFGQPGNEKWNDSEFLSRYSLWLAIRRLKKDGAIQDKHRQLTERLREARTPYEEKIMVKQYRQAVFSQARETFYWEKALGMCPICFHWWVSLFLFSTVNLFYQSSSFFTFGFNLMLSHLFIRLLKKFV